MNENRDMWNCICLYTETQTTVSGLRQAKAYCHYMGANFKPPESNRQCGFGNEKQFSNECIIVRTSITDEMFLT